MLRKLVLKLLIITVAVYLVIYLIPGLVFAGSIIEFTQIVGVVFAVNLLIKPVTKILPLPFKVLELGLVSIGLDALALWFASMWIPLFKITSFWFSGISGSGFVIAPIEIPVIGTAVIAALMLGLVSTTLYTLTK